MNDWDFTNEDFLSQFKLRYELLTANKTVADKPQAFILGGQPGAGKTGLQLIMRKKLNDNIVVINGDEFRELHPNFKMLQEKYGKDSVDYTGAFSGKMTETLIEKLKENKYNVLVEGTLRTSQVPIQTCKDFKESGYETTLALIAVKPQISFISTILRYEDMIESGKTPRATAKDKHDYVVEHIPENLKEIYDSGLFDNIVIYNREGTCLYDMAKDETAPNEVMRNALNGKWSMSELKQFLEIGQEVKQLMKKRNANELKDFNENIFNGKIISEIAERNGYKVIKKTSFEVEKEKQSITPPPRKHRMK